MITVAKVLLFPALALCGFVFFLYFIGGGTTGRQSDAVKGMLFGGTGGAACLFCAYRIYFGSGLSKWEWLALPVALSPIALIAIQTMRSNQARAASHAARNQ
jgi:hypothetical protein